MSRRILRLPDVLTRVPLGRTAIYGKIKLGQFPAPVKMGGASGWFEHEIEAWMDKLAAARTPAESPSEGASSHSPTARPA